MGVYIYEDFMRKFDDCFYNLIKKTVRGFHSLFACAPSKYFFQNLGRAKLDCIEKSVEYF